MNKLLLVIALLSFKSQSIMNCKKGFHDYFESDNVFILPFITIHLTLPNSCPYCRSKDNLTLHQIVRGVKLSAVSNCPLILIVISIVLNTSSRPMMTNVHCSEENNNV